jgi:adenylosuccinate lyase
VQQYLSAVEIADCFDPQRHLKHLDQVYQRLGI